MFTLIFNLFSLLELEFHILFCSCQLLQFYLFYTVFLQFMIDIRFFPSGMMLVFNRLSVHDAKLPLA